MRVPAENSTQALPCGARTRLRGRSTAKLRSVKERGYTRYKRERLGSSRPTLQECSKKAYSVAMSESDADVVHEDTGVTVKLTERDIPGALLNEPFEIHTIPELKWWLLCRGIQAASTWKKPKIISRICEAGGCRRRRILPISKVSERGN